MEARPCTVVALRVICRGRRTIIRNEIQTSVAHPGSAATNLSEPAPVQPLKRKRKKSGLKLSAIAIYASIFILIVVMIGVSYRAPQEVGGSEVSANSASTPSSTGSSGTPAVNEVVAANIAANMAVSSDLPVATAVANLAASTQIKSQYEQADASSVQKPTIIELTAGSRSIISYTTKAGDTVQSVARQFGISVQTLKWANNLTDDSFSAGTQLEVPPVNGVIYITKVGDTAASIAERYQANASRIVSFNDLEVSGIRPGQKIILPGGILPVTERPGYTPPYLSYGYSGGDYTVVDPYKYISVNIYSYRMGAGNKNYNGQCTWWVWERRAAIGRPLPSYALGDAADWVYSLSGSHKVNRTPAVGAVMQNGRGTVSWAGHVAIVERINSDGSILISEMNYGAAFRVTERTIPAYAVGMFNYIH